MLFQFGIVDQYYSNFEIEIPNLEFQICYFFLGALRAQIKMYRFCTAERYFALYFHDFIICARSAPRKKSIFGISNSEFQFQNWNNIDPQFQIEITLTVFVSLALGRELELY